MLSIRLGRATFNPAELAPTSAPLRVAPAHASCADAHDCRACHNRTSVFADTSGLAGAKATAYEERSFEQSESMKLKYQEALLLVRPAQLSDCYIRQFSLARPSAR